MGHVFGNAVRGLYYAVLSPSRLVSVPPRQTERSVLEQLRQSRELLTVYIVNLALYAGPLTLAGIGISSDSSVPTWLVGVTGESSGTTAIFISGFIQNSLYLFGVTVATLIGIHIALVVTFQSKGVLRTAYSIVYSTSVYLAGIFTVVWYLTTAQGVQNARTFVINLQVEFIYRILEYTGSDIVFAQARPETIVPSAFSTVGEYALLTLAVLVLYYFYSLYLGARLNHDAGRFEGILVILVVISLPILYVAGSVFVILVQQSPIPL